MPTPSRRSTKSGSSRPGYRVESKSVKLYLETFREQGIFHEHLATTIRDDFVAALDPLSLDVTANLQLARRNCHLGDEFVRRRSRRPGLAGTALGGQPGSGGRSIVQV